METVDRNTMLGFGVSYFLATFTKFNDGPKETLHHEALIRASGGAIGAYIGTIIIGTDDLFIPLGLGVFFSLMSLSILL